VLLFASETGHYEQLADSPPSLLLCAGSATFQPFFDGAEDVEAEVVLLPIFMLIGLLSGVIGALFVRANAAWSRFRAKRAGTFFFQSKYYLTVVMLLLWGLVTMPDGPVGPFMSKSQMGSLNELFSSDTMSDEWGQGEPQLIVNLLVFFCLRIAFTCIGITLPMPAGVFAPSLCAGAGLGRVVGEGVRYLLPEHDTSPGGYAVLGAAAMAAGVTHTISSAVLMFELTGGMKHALPMLLTVVISYMVRHPPPAVAARALRSAHPRATLPWPIAQTNPIPNPNSNSN
jgi:chloride channel 2